MNHPCDGQTDRQTDGIAIAYARLQHNAVARKNPAEGLPSHRGRLRSLSIERPRPCQMRDGDLNCVAQRVLEHFDGALGSQGLTPTRRRKISECEGRVHETGATVGDVTVLERILKRAIILRGMAGEEV